MTTTWLATAGDVIKGNAQGACGSSCGGGVLSVTFSSIANTLIYIIGAVAVIMIIIGGLRYVLANGDAKSAAEAKSTILYAVIGVIVATSAYAIVNFVTSNVK